MNSAIKRWLLRWSPVPLSTNHRYDRLMYRILKKHCRPDWRCVDVGAHAGYFLQQYLRLAPNGHHWAFEPLPILYDRLLVRYRSPRCTILPFALSDRDEEQDFNYVITNPAYSGLKKRPYDRPEQDQLIRVATRRLDSLLPSTSKIDFIKIDVEGGEWDVLHGARRVLQQSRPLVAFEFGVAATAYGVTAAMCWDFFAALDYHVFQLKNFLHKKDYLDRENYQQLVETGKAYFFIAAPFDPPMNNTGN